MGPFPSRSSVGELLSESFQTPHGCRDVVQDFFRGCLLRRAGPSSEGAVAFFADDALAFRSYSASLLLRVAISESLESEFRS